MSNRLGYLSLLGLEDEGDVLLEQSEQEVEEEEQEIEGSSISEFSMVSIGQEPEDMSLGLHEDITEESTSGVVHTLLHFHKKIKESELEEDISFYVSTAGGSVYEMFSIYDVMERVKRDVDIETVGLGKVMSAGVPILAAGTKGKRKIGRYCRIMIHRADTQMGGNTDQAQNTLNEVTAQEENYAKILSENSNLTFEEVKEMFKANINHYFSAEEAIEMGIADEIF